ncbi:MAG: hypothetical protein K2Y21_04400 [Phycisphaerales bacterium]|nr:hypothetical protein [Phycisphaerales bacterium]
MNPSTVGIGILSIVGVILAVAIAVLLISYLIVPIFKAFAWVVARLFHFIVGVIKDAVRFIGAVLAIIVFSPLVVANIIIGRWSASSHFGRAIKNELAIAGACLFRVLLAHPARLFGMDGLVEGLEQRFPEAVAQAPTSEPHGKRAGQFEGYKIVGSLPTGGSGSKLYIAEPDPIKRAALERSGFQGVDQVVIKSFSVADGSNLPNIVRESRALEAAKKLGLVLDHELSPAKFYYVMRYVPGQTLNVVVQQLHGQSDPSLKPPGLDDRNLRLALSYVADLVANLDQYHTGGLWHKDVKPENIIVDNLHGNARAHLVDFGLVTPLRSAMTLTTHGTEYFRDPELVRLALRGVKVHEVDGAKFDIYAAGAVLFAVVENSFPAHGVLSQVTRRCPEAVKWVIRRAMADYDKRYTSAAQMLADLSVVRSASDPFAVRPIDLPSMRGGVVETPQADPDVIGAAMHAAGAAAVSPGPAFGTTPPPFTPEQQRSVGNGAGFAGVGNPADASSGGARRRPDIRVVNWWTGEHVEVPEGPSTIPNQADGPFGFDASNIRAHAHDFAKKSSDWAQQAVNAAKRGEGFAGIGVGSVKVGSVKVGSPFPAGVRRSAREQIEAAKARVEARRARVQSRRASFTVGHYSNKPNAGAFVGLAIFLAATIGFGGFILKSARQGSSVEVASSEPSSSEPVARGTGRQTTSAVRDGAIETITFSEASTPATRKKSKNVVAPAPTTPKSLPSETTASVLFVSDLPAPLNDSSAKVVAQMCDALRTAGFTVTGDTPDAKIEDRETIDRLAAARLAVSGAEIASPKFRDSLSVWAAEKSVDLVVWLRPQTDSAGKADTSKPPITHVIAKPDAADLVRDTARDAIAVGLKNAAIK